jgi:2-dehydro-3-deoxyphosphooctonate aldolase (KDO 8-P synthase)
MNPCNIGPVQFGKGKLALIAGPCVAESLDMCLDIASTLKRACLRLDVGYVFKASFDKANRSSGDSFRGPGLAAGLEWLAAVRRKLDVPVLSDVHECCQVAPAAGVLDCLQIPAFLCRQTDLLLACAATGKCVNIKKGQFMAPWDMKGAAQKVASAGKGGVLLTERGSSFGYNRLVVDFTGLAVMRQWAPVVFDATHSVMEPGALGHASGGNRQAAPALAMAAMAAGADALFLETHPDPASAKSDAATQMPLTDVESLLERCLRVRQAAR